MKIKLLIVTTFLLAAVSCDRPEATVVDGPPIGPENAQPVDASTPEATRPLPKGTTVSADGSLQAVNPPFSLSFNVAGRLSALYPQVGETVAPGDLIALLDDSAARDTISSAQLSVAQSRTSLDQAQLNLDTLLAWEADPLVVAQAEANLAAAEANLAYARNQDANAGSGLTASRINLTQAQRGLEDAREAYRIAFDPGRDWELNITDMTCLPGQGGPIPCTGAPKKLMIEAERAGAENAVQRAEENLLIAQANYNLAVSSVNDHTAVSAEATVAGAALSLDQAQTGPRESEIAAARLSVTQAELALQAAEFSLAQAQAALDELTLTASRGGKVLSVDALTGTMIGGGMPLITLLDVGQLRFHTSNLSERDLGQLELGQKVELHLKAFTDAPLPGSVAYVVPTASGIVGDAATFTVVIELEPTDLPLLPGMTGRVEIFMGDS